MNALAAALAALAPLSVPSIGPMTIDQAVSIAESNAFQIRIARSNVERSRQVLRQAQALLGPQMSTTTTYTRFDKELRANFGPQSIVTRPIDSTTSQVQVGLPIDISRTIQQGIEAARNQLKASEAALAAEQEAVRLQVRTAYYRVLQTEEQVRVGEEQVRLAKERLANAEAAVRAGAGAKIDVLTFETFVAQSESELVAFRNQLTLARQFLNNTLGRPIDTEFDAVDVEGLPAYPADVDRLVETALKRRPDLRSIEFSREALKYVRQGEERGLRPSLSVGVGYTYNWDPQGFGSERGTTAGTVTLSVPLFDNGVTRARVKAARQDEEQIEVRIEQARLGVSLEVRQALTNLENAKARYEFATRAVAQAEEAYRLSVLRLDAGEGIRVEVTDAQTNLTRARTGLVAARYDYLIAFAQLQKAIGPDEPAHIAADSHTAVTHVTDGGENP